MKRIQYETVAGWFADRGCTLLTSKEEYDKGPGTNRWKVKYIASCGHVHKMGVMTFMQGHGTKCPKCAHLEVPSEESLKSMCDAVECKFLRLVSFNGINRCKLEIIARCGHKKTVNYRTVQLARNRKETIPCDECRKTKKKTIDEVRALFESNGCKLIDTEYRGKDHKMQYIASCGHLHFISYHNFSSGWGRICPACSASRSAAVVGEFLDETFGNIIREYQCKPTLMKVDFYIPLLDVAVEYDGKQHFEPVGKFGGESEFKTIKERDRRKEKWCKEHHVRLIRIDGRKWNYHTMNDDFKAWLMEKINEKES